MASSGWQGEQQIQFRYPYIVLDLYISSISHVGTTLNYSGYVQVKCTGGWITHADASVSLTGGGSKTLGLYLNSGQSAFTDTFNCSVSGVSASATTYTVTASLDAGSDASGSASWTLSFPTGGSGPQNPVPTLNSVTWNSVNMTTTIDSWGGVSGNGSLECIIIDPSAPGSPDWWDEGRLVKRTSTSALTYTTTVSNTDYNSAYDGGYDISKGMTPFKIGSWANIGGISANAYDNTVYYTAPAPGQLSYTAQSVSDYDVTYAGVAADNYASHDPTQLTRTVRYRAQGASTWTYVENGAVVALTTVTTFQVSIPASTTYEVEAWMEYEGVQSEVSRTTITNSSTPTAKLYASARGVAREVTKVYGSVNGQTKKVKKLYGSVNGVAKLIFEDNS